MNEEGAELIVTVLEAKELLGPPDEDTMDTFVRIYLVPDEGRAMQTKVRKIIPMTFPTSSDRPLNFSSSRTHRVPVTTRLSVSGWLVNIPGTPCGSTCTTAECTSTR